MAHLYSRCLEGGAWPLWLAHGIDWKRRGFHEHLDLASLRCHAEFRRLRVAARQTYVFSKAASCGVPDAREAVLLGLDFLQGPARLPRAASPGASISTTGRSIGRAISTVMPSCCSPSPRRRRWSASKACVR